MYIVYKYIHVCKNKYTCVYIYIYLLIYIYIHISNSYKQISKQKNKELTNSANQLVWDPVVWIPGIPLWTGLLLGIVDQSTPSPPKKKVHFNLFFC